MMDSTPAVNRACRGAVIPILLDVTIPFLEIVRYGKAHDIDLIVTGAHGRGAVAHMLIGSVAERVVRKAPCPVLTVRDLGPVHRYSFCPALACSTVVSLMVPMRSF